MAAEIDLVAKFAQEAVWLYFENIPWILAGVIVGMILGVIPGMGGVVTLVLLLPLTLGMDKFQAFAILSGGLGATTYTGSITGILINTPGTSSNAATIIDGYPLTQRGEAATALGASAFASATGAIVAVVIFLLSLPFLLDIALAFGPSEVFWLVIGALVVLPFLVGDKPLAGIATAGMGLIATFIGRAPQTAEPRFTFGQTALFDGLPILAPLVGLFALAEIFRLASIDRKMVVPETVKMSGNRLRGVKEVIKHRWLWLRCSILGLIIGAVPGAGGASSSFIAYGHAVQSAKNKTGFGEGRIEGVIASEAANDAKDGGQLFPSMALGIPGSASMAVFLAGLLAHGMFPGPRTLIDNIELVMVVALSLGTANIMTSIIGFTLINQFTRLLKISVQRLLPAITVLALTAAYLGRNQFNDVIMTLAFALFGAVLIYVGVSRVPFLIAFVLGSLLEQNFYLASQFAGGNIYEGFFTGTLNLILIGIVLLSVIAITLPDRYVKRLKRGLGRVRP